MMQPTNRAIRFAAAAENRYEKGNSTMLHDPGSPPAPSASRFRWATLSCLTLTILTGCYTPLHSPGIPACELPYEFRMPYRSTAQELNLAKLTVPPPADYILGPNDTLDVMVPGLYENAEVQPIRSRIMADETITLPLVGKVKVGGLNLSAAQDVVNEAFADGFLVNPRVSVALAEKHMIDVSIIGQVNKPGVYQLPRYQNDVGHALALAEGMGELAAEKVEVHRRVSREEFETRYLPLCGTPVMVEPQMPVEPTQALEPESGEGADGEGQSSWREPIDLRFETQTAGSVVFDRSYPEIQPVSFGHSTFTSDETYQGPPLPQEQAPMAMSAPVCMPGNAGHDQVDVVLHIPLRGGQISMTWEGGEFIVPALTAKDVTLTSGDVVQIPRKPDDVFFVTGRLAKGSFLNYSVQGRDRELGNALLIPPNRDIDVVTAVAMAGYIDPIDSPDTVTVQRSVPGDTPMLIHVDLIAARFDWNQNLYIQPGDIIYLNPDCAWWTRYQFDRIVPILLTAPYTNWMGYLINPNVRN